MIGRRCKADRLHPLIPRESPRWWKLYKGRAAVEREFGRLKNEWRCSRSAFAAWIRLHCTQT